MILMHFYVLTSDVEILQFLSVVSDGQVEHQQLLGVALPRAVNQRTGEVVVVLGLLVLLGGGRAGAGGGHSPSLPAGGSRGGGGRGAGAVVPRGGEVPGASHSHMAKLKYQSCYKMR